MVFKKLVSIVSARVLAESERERFNFSLAQVHAIIIFLRLPKEIRAFLHTLFGARKRTKKLDIFYASRATRKPICSVVVGVRTFAPPFLRHAKAEKVRALSDYFGFAISRSLFSHESRHD